MSANPHLLPWGLVAIRRAGEELAFTGHIRALAVSSPVRRPRLLTVLLLSISNRWWRGCWWLRGGVFRVPRFVVLPLLESDVGYLVAPARRIHFSSVDVIVPVHQVLDLPLDDPLIKDLADRVPLFGLRGAFGTALVRLPLSASSGHGYCGTGVAGGGETRGAQDVGRRRQVESYSWNYSCDSLDRPGRACDDRVQRSTLRYKSTEACRATTMITRLLARRRAEEQAISVPLTHVILLKVLELGRRQHDRATASGWLEGPLLFRAPL